MLFKKKQPAPAPSRTTAATTDHEDLCRDTLANILRTLGEQALPTERFEVTEFQERCDAFARRVLTGSTDKEKTSGLKRLYQEIKLLVRDQRKIESTEYSKHRQSAHIIVADLVSSLRKSLEQRQNHDRKIVTALAEMEDAVSSGNLLRIQQVSTKTAHQIKHVIATQREADQRRLQSLSDQLREMKEELEDAQSQMKTDALTGLYNRGAFDESFKKLVDIANASANELTLFMLDIDHFKSVNDTYGHQAGDEVLQGLGKELIRAFPRKDDMVVRYGGEEFSILCKNTGRKDAFMLGERVRNQVSRLKFSLNGVKYQPTISVGWASLDKNENESALLKRADTALYAAKSAGRNCVMPKE